MARVAVGWVLADLRLEQVDAFVSLKGAQGWCRVSIATAVKALRMFFRYAAGQGQRSTSLATGIAFARNRLKSMQRRPRLITAFWQQAQLPI